MTTRKVTLLTRYEHRDNGTSSQYLPGDVGEFNERLASSLVYEGMAVFEPSDEQGDTQSVEDRETKVSEPDETKPAKTARSKK